MDMTHAAEIHAMDGSHAADSRIIDRSGGRAQAPESSIGLK
jgi:hypothetical protein